MLLSKMTDKQLNIRPVAHTFNIILDCVSVPVAHISA